MQLMHFKFDRDGSEKTKSWFRIIHDLLNSTNLRTHQGTLAVWDSAGVILQVINQNTTSLHVSK